MYAYIGLLIIKYQNAASTIEQYGEIEGLMCVARCTQQKASRLCMTNAECVTSTKLHLIYNN